MLLSLAKHISNVTGMVFEVILKDVEKTGIDISREEGQREGGIGRGTRDWEKEGEGGRKTGWGMGGKNGFVRSNGHRE